MVWWCRWCWWGGSRISNSLRSGKNPGPPAQRGKAPPGGGSGAAPPTPSKMTHNTALPLMLHHAWHPVKGKRGCCLPHTRWEGDHTYTGNNGSPHGNFKHSSTSQPIFKHKVPSCFIFKCGSDEPRAAARKSCHDIRLFLEHIAPFRPNSSALRMVGVKGRSGGCRPGAGRRPGATAIKKKAKGLPAFTQWPASCVRCAQ